jgi:hypothetical protein
MPRRVNIDSIPWGTLIEQIEAKACTPFIGAGASYPVLPKARELAAQLLQQDEELSKNLCPIVERDDLAKVCQYLAVSHESSSWPKRKIAELLSQLGPPSIDDMNEPHRVLASIELPLYITTNYDDFMWCALRRRIPSAKREHARWTKNMLSTHDSVVDHGYVPSPIDPVVFHLHGHTGNIRTMVASEDDYLDFLVNVSKDLANSPNSLGQRVVLPLPVRTAITNTTLMFIGYGLADINFRVILRGLVGSLEQGEAETSLAVQFARDEDPLELQYYLERYFKWAFKLSVYWGSAQEFASELRSRWQKRNA